MSSTSLNEAPLENANSQQDLEEKLIASDE
jgi:hypothetical protein